MAVYRDPIHGRLKLIVKNSGGYNRKYHIEKISQEYNLNITEITEIFNMTLDSEVLNEYLTLLTQGKAIKYIRDLNNTRKQNLNIKIAAMLGILGGLDSYYK